jgi:NAD(P)-dependent dehydrogenase (short-subunit alcohol dehydrogenase family)
VNLSGKVVAITGGLGVLGQAVDAVVANYGAKVVLIDHAPAPAPPPRPTVLQFCGIDVADKKSADTVMNGIAQWAGRLDALVNTAGGFQWELVEGGAAETWDALFRLNVKTALVASQAALPLLLQSGGGRIVNVGAMGAIKAASGMGAYGAAKAGVAKLTEALAEELKDRAVTVNAVLPSILDTPRNRADMPKADFTRWVAPSAVAEVIAFLISSESHAVTGALIPVAGRV